jgi:predicted N-acetyltransferase YhbS
MNMAVRIGAWDEANLDSLIRFGAMTFGGSADSGLAVERQLGVVDTASSLFAEVAGNTIAVVQVNPVALAGPPGRPWACITGLGVSPEWRGKLLGSALLQQCLDRTRYAGYAGAFCWTEHPRMLPGEFAVLGTFDLKRVSLVQTAPSRRMKVTLTGPAAADLDAMNSLEHDLGTWMSDPTMLAALYAPAPQSEFVAVARRNGEVVGHAYGALRPGSMLTLQRIVSRESPCDFTSALAERAGVAVVRLLTGAPEGRTHLCATNTGVFPSLDHLPAYT